MAALLKYQTIKRLAKETSLTAYKRGRIYPLTAIETGILQGEFHH